MNNYIIDPSVFYWVNVFGSLQIVFAIFGAILTISGIGFLIGWFMYHNEKFDYDTESEYYIRAKRYEKLCKQWVMVLLIIGIPLVLVSIFIPSKQTGIEMMVAKTATFENVDWTVAQVKEIIDYIVSALNGV